MFMPGVGPGLDPRRPLLGLDAGEEEAQYDAGLVLLLHTHCIATNNNSDHGEFDIEN